MLYTLVVNGEPVAKARPRIVDGHAFTPSKTKDAETNIAWEFKSKYPGIKVDGDSQFDIDITFIVSCYKNGKPRRFDLDNGIKMLLDALTGIVWEDDNQVVSLAAEKFDGDVGRTNFVIRTL